MTDFLDDQQQYQKELFSALSHDLRLRIVHELGKQRGEEGLLDGVPFSELRERVGATTEDGFNYHLSKLEGSLVKCGHSETIEEYTLTDAGVLLYRALASGILERPDDRGTVSIDGSCFYCDSQLTAKVFPQGSPAVLVGCSECGHMYRPYWPVDPSVVGDDVEETLHRLSTRRRKRCESFRRGACMHCGGTVSTTVRSDEESLRRASRNLSYVVTSRCDSCSHVVITSVGEYLRDHPRVVQFFRERGRDVVDEPIWEVEFAGTDRHTEEVRRDPLRIAVDMHCDGDTLSVTVDESGTVVGITEG